MELALQGYCPELTCVKLLEGATQKVLGPEQWAVIVPNSQSEGSMLNFLKCLHDPGQEGYPRKVMTLAGTALASGPSSADAVPGAVVAIL